MNLKIDRLAHVWTQRDERGIEALQMSDLQNRFAFRGSCDHLVGLGKRSRDGFLNQHVDARCKQAAGDFAVRLGRDRQAYRVYLADEFVPVSRPLRLSFRGDIARGFFVEVANESKLSQAFSGEIGMDARVLPAQMAHADYCGTKLHTRR